MVEAPKRSVCELAPEHLARIRRRLVGERGLGLDGKAPLSRPGSKSHESPTFIPVRMHEGKKGGTAGARVNRTPSLARDGYFFASHDILAGIGNTQYPRRCEELWESA